MSELDPKKKAGEKVSELDLKKKAGERESEDDKFQFAVDNVNAGDAGCGTSGGEVGLVVNFQPIIVNCTGSNCQGENGNNNVKDVKNVKNVKYGKRLRNRALEQSLGTNWMNKIIKLRCANTNDPVDAKVVGVKLDDDTNNPVWRLSCDDHGGQYLYLNLDEMQDAVEFNAQNNGKNRFNGFAIFPRYRYEQRKRIKRDT